MIWRKLHLTMQAKMIWKNDLNGTGEKRSLKGVGAYWYREVSKTKEL